MFYYTSGQFSASSHSKSKSKCYMSSYQTKMGQKQTLKNPIALIYWFITQHTDVEQHFYPIFLSVSRSVFDSKSHELLLWLQNSSPFQKTWTWNGLWKKSLEETALNNRRRKNNLVRHVLAHGQRWKTNFNLAWGREKNKLKTVLRNNLKILAVVTNVS